jgi:hypothetical protein
MTAHEQCEACGFDGASFDDHELLDTICSLGPRWRALLGSAGAQLRTRPAPEVWSAVEYAAHSRDITTLHVFGVEQALTGDEPVFPAIAADDMISAAAADYGTADPDEVATELARQATLLADAAAAAGSEAWSRGLTIGDERSDVRALLEHGLHDSLHHLADVERGLALLRP